MREFYFVVEAVTRKPEKDMRVYRTEKARKEQGNYRETAKQVSDIQVVKRNRNRQSTDSTVVSQQESSLQNCSSSTLEAELMMQHTISLEERQEQLQFQKRGQESSRRRNQMLTAYGKE